MKNENSVKEELIELRNIMFYNFLLEDNKFLKGVYLKKCDDLNKLLWDDFKIDCYRMFKNGFVNKDGYIIWV
jgi:hypothetical protein